MSLPIQPIVTDEHGVVRFKANAIVRYLLDHGGIDLNRIAMKEFSAEDQQQFAQLIGYSVSGYCDLSYVDDYACNVAEQVAAGIPQEQARIAYLESTLAEVRAKLKGPIAQLFGIHPDDLERSL